MTGYGKAECEYQLKKISIEVRALNSKQLDFNLKLPSFYKEKEVDIRNEISKELERGKIDVYINVEDGSEESQVNINKGIVRGYYTQISEVSKELDLKVPDDILSTILRLPDALKADRQEISEKEWETILAGVHKALDMLQEFRLQEGTALAKDIKSRIENIEEYAGQLSQFETARIDKLKQRLRQTIEDYVGKDQVDNNRFEQELIYYLEKFDVTEEKVRLANHCKYFFETMAEKEANGKKLGFITQEIGREINTIGSKANDASMQKLVVKMKDELEKIKEQINNIL